VSEFELLIHILGAPVGACLVLAGIHAYLGVHVIARKVIFVDLALAQIAAFGSTYAVLLGYSLRDSKDSVAVYLCSLVFAVLGAVLLTLTRMKQEKIPHEAIIGIVYAVASAATIMVASYLPQGAEEIQYLLSGNVENVRWGKVGLTAGIYAIVGLIHFVFRARLLAASGVDGEEVHSRGWDFLFYLTFAVVITSSVSIAGILLVFSYLVIPAVIAILFAERMRSRLLIGWGTGALGSVAGAVIAYYMERPIGPTVVVTFGTCLALAGAVYVVKESDRKLNTVGSLAGVAAGIGLLIFGSSMFQKDHGHEEIIDLLQSDHVEERLLGLHELEHDKHYLIENLGMVGALVTDSDAAIRKEAIHVLAESGDERAVAFLLRALSDTDPAIREAAVREIHDLATEDQRNDIAAALEAESDPYIANLLSKSLLDLGDAFGAIGLLNSMETGEFPLARDEAWSSFKSLLPVELSFDPGADSSVRAEQVGAIRTWLEENRDQLEFDEHERRFRLK
jgi:zinc/manganese transport system permease protein